MQNRLRGRVVRRLLWIAAAVASFGAAPALAVCTVSPGADDLGTASPAALTATGSPAVSATPYVAGTAGFSCSNSSLITLSGVNRLKATIPTGTVLKLVAPGNTTDSITYQVAGAADGTTPYTAGSTVTLVNGSLSLLTIGSGSGPMSVPIYVKPTAVGSTLIAPGTYTGTFKINWDWYFCSGVYTTLTGCTLGTVDTGTGQSVVTVTVIVAAKPPTMTISSVTTYDTVDGTVSPKALPGSKRRTTVTVTNPDILTLAAGTVQITLPTALRTSVALDGESPSSTTFVQTADGSPASGLALTYSAPDSTSDDVDFSTDNGSSWGASPSVASQGTITTIRFRPRGTMAPGSSFSISVPYSVQ